ncbi:MAG: serine/threonine-protein kinase [Thermostichus sp. BF3_bins_97]
MSRRARTTKSIHDTYQLLGLAGQGQYGRVFCARPRQGGELVALKELQAQRFPTHNLLRELRYLLSLNHPNITRCYALEHAREGRYLVLEYCEGGTLRDLINQVEQGLWLPVKQVLGFADQILAGLAHAHQQGVIHCDVKPENILLKPTPQGWQLKLTDFGIARHPEPISGEITATGSPAYMAPERFYGHFSAASDLYAVGIILVELLTGQRPFSGSPSQLMHAHLNQRFVCPMEIPTPLQALLELALRKLPPRRFRTASQMRSALAVFAQEWQEPDSCWVGPRLPKLSPPVVQVWDLPDQDPEPEQQVCICEDPGGSGSPMVLRATPKAVEWLELQSLSVGSPAVSAFSLDEPLQTLLPLGTFPEALALSKSSLLHLSPSHIRTLLSFEEDWQAAWLTERQELFWATTQELGAVQWHSSASDPTQAHLFPESHRYFRWDWQSLQPDWQGSLPQLLALSEHLVLLAGVGRQHVQMGLLPNPLGLPQQAGSQPVVYRLPLEPEMAVVSLGERLLFVGDKDAKSAGLGVKNRSYLCSVQVNPLRVRYWFLKEPLVQMVKAPWGVLLLCRDGMSSCSLWLYGEGGDPLAQMALPSGSVVLQVGQRGRVWLQVPKAGDPQRSELWQLDMNQLQLKDPTPAPIYCDDG